MVNQEKFWSKVQKGGPDECWNWISTISPQTGHAVFWTSNNYIGAHRISLSLLLGRELLPNEWVRRSCNNLICVNPSHARILVSKNFETSKVQKSCSVDSCDKKNYAHGFCMKHYRRFTRWGDPLANPKVKYYCDESVKECSSCGLILKHKHFSKDRSSTGLYSQCKSCRKISRLTKAYSLTKEEYLELVKRAGGRCEICGKESTNLHIDHDHSCCPESSQSCGNCVRGMLCPYCNGLLGKIETREKFLLNVSNYILERKVDGVTI